MEKKILDILVDMKLDMGDIKGCMGRMESDISVIKSDIGELKGRGGNLESDMSEVKSTVNSLAGALLETSREVRHLKAAK